MASVLRHALNSGVRALRTSTSARSLAGGARSLPPHLQKLLDYGEMYPDLLPDPNIEHRHSLAESLERKDMLKRFIGQIFSY